MLLTKFDDAGPFIGRRTRKHTHRNLTKYLQLHFCMGEISESKELVGDLGDVTGSFL
ncbi:hypothetical protein RchiOBHm_Chr5g0019371 [Rosa chinensis]|uniref:Uncharacterized protein n=1 Tax=Rosa chinensis TaxID=74649 RepID=A0A2P6Q6Z9_ROSCH|nr:hypothetical protein RchiOBHm_Chr5g0019371 [Rosa chinensis]